MLLISLSLLTQAQSSSQTDGAEPELTTQVGRLVRQLDGDSLENRQSAEKALIELGPDVLKLLPTITPRTPAEVKQRLARIRTALEKAAAQAVAQPTRVALEGEMSLASALEAIQQQTGNRVVGHQYPGFDFSAQAP